MISKESSLAENPNEEIPALIETLLATEQRLEDLTDGQVDSVSGRDGRTFVLRRAQDQLPRNEAVKQSAILNALPAHIALLDDQGFIISVNEAWRCFADANALDAPRHGVGLNYLAICDQAQGGYSAESHQIAAGIRGVLDRREHSFSIEYPCHSPTEQRWFLLTVTPLASDRPNGAVVMHLNITEGKQSELASTRVAAIVESSADAIIGKDLTSNITSWNRGAERVFGYTASEMVGTSIQRLIPPERHDEESEILRRMERGEAIDQFETVRLTKDRQLIDVSVTISPIKDGEGNVVGVAKVARDITERKVAAARLDELSQKTDRRERMLTTLLANLHDFASIYDRAGRFLFANQPLLDLLGLTLDTVVGKNLYELGLSDDLARSTQQQLQDVFETGKSITGETPYVSPAGVQGFYEYIFSPAFGGNGIVEFVVGSTRDITKRKTAEVALQASQKRVRDIIDGMGPAMFVGLLTTQGILVEVNQAPLTAAGLKAEDVLGLPFADSPWWSHSPEAQQQLREAIKRAARGEASRYDVQTQGAGNQVIDVDFSLQPLRNEAGEVVFLIPSANVITERKQAEESLREIELRLAHAMRMAQLVAWEYDPATELFTFSDRYYVLHGTTAELEGGNLMSAEDFARRFVHPDDAHIVGDEIGKALTTADPDYQTQLECRIFRRDGDLRLALVSISITKDDAGRTILIHGSNQDITDRKRTEDALRVSEERLRAALAASRTGTFRWDIRTNELGWDDSLDALFGVPQGQAIHSLETFIAAVHPDDRPEVIERCERCARDGADFDMEFRVVWPDGTLHWLDDKGKTFFDAAGVPLYMTGACVDITERKLAEMALRESEAEFRALAEAMPQMVWITRPDGWNLYFSQQWVDYTGLTVEESLGHGWIKPFHPDDQERSWEAWQQATSTGGVYSIESRLRRADGEYRWWLIRGVPRKDASDNILKWFGTCTDIHELKLAELEISRANQALRDSDEKFRELSDNITDVFWILSPDFETMHYVSVGYELIWGRSTESLYANPHQWIEAILPEERESVFAVFATLMGTALDVTVEYRIARPDGTVRWIHDRGFQVRDAAGKLVRITGIASDITERKKMEAQLNQAQKLEAIGTLAGGIAHDFNNILAAIMGYTELAQKGLSPNDRPHAQLAQVLKASGRARDLVQQILTFSRREEHEEQVLRVQDIIEETLDLIRDSLPATIEIKRTIDHAVPLILGDAIQIQQLIMNLCLNAGHAMKQGNGILGISLTSPDIGAHFREAHPELGEGPHVLLSISDTGCGIDTAAQTRIFDPFYTTKPPGEGTGLGLAVVHGVVKNHDGVITVQSEVGAGTTFSIYLPVCERPAGAVVQEAVNIPRGNGEHILFVDDEAALASLGKLMLEDIGYRVTAKTDSVESLEAFRSQPEAFDLVVTDQTMPHLNGADFATALLEIRPALPVILLTGYSSTMSPEIAKAIGIGELLLKPCPMHVLGEAIHRALRVGQKNQ